jgi:GT2 family glycosyltransferase
MGFLRAALADLGPSPFDPGFRGTSYLEETHVFTRLIRAGWQVRFVAEARLHHLAAPTGGVRRAPIEAEHWRFYNTARYLAIHRGAAGVAVAAPAWAGQAARIAYRHRDFRLMPRLISAYLRGVLDSTE